MYCYSLYKKLYKNIIKYTFKYKKIEIFILITLLICIWFYYPCAQNDFESSERLPTVLIVSLIRNKAHTLPYFFSCLENLYYPKSRLTLLLQSDHNEDNSIELINLWINRTSNLYKYVELQFENVPTRYQNETSPNDWTKERLSHVIKLKERALERGHKLLNDFIFFLDADVFLTNRNTLTLLTSYKLPIISPILLSQGIQSSISRKTAKYKRKYKREKIGNFRVPIVHSAILINLNLYNSKFLTFDRRKLNQDPEIKNDNSIKLYNLAKDDITTFTMSADRLGMPIFISNATNYGYILQPLAKNDEIYRDNEKLLNIKLDIINDLGVGIEIKKEFKKYIFYPKKNKLSLDQIYVINLERRPEYRKKMELSFDELSLDVEYFPAIDGKILNFSTIEQMGIKFLPLNEELYYMKMGKIGCFLSHYKIWQKIIEHGQREVLVLEDDVIFEPNFHKNAINILNEARKVGNWDLLYFGRRSPQYEEETCVKGAQNLIYARYSQGTFGYVITLKGAKKLIDIKPLEKLVPVDEFLSIMFDRHPYDTWKKVFKTRNLLAYSAKPLLVYPTYHTSDEGHISDTEYSRVMPMKYRNNIISRIQKKGKLYL